jgi:hypothetical protein
MIDPNTNMEPQKNLLLLGILEVAAFEFHVTIQRCAADLESHNPGCWTHPGASAPAYVSNSLNFTLRFPQVRHVKTLV